MFIELTLLIMTSAIIAWLATRAVIHFAPRIGLVHQPNHRSSHVKVTPHGGGIGIIISTLFFTAWLLWRDESSHFSYYWIAVGLSLIVALIGLLDDIYHLSAKLRLFVQFAVSSALLITLYTIPANGLDPIAILPVWLSFILVLFAGTWWLNLFNFMDGIDGLAAIQTIFMLSGAAFLIATVSLDVSITTTVWVWMLCLSAATIGFLIHNWSPATIFMGDVGSLFLAFMILFLALLTISLKWMTYTSWVILGAVFISDTSITLLRRIIKGEAVTQAHNSHAYQILARRWGAHKKVSLLVLLINITWLLPCAYLALLFPQQSMYWVVLSYFPLLLGVGWLSQNKTSFDKEKCRATLSRDTR